MLNRCFLIFCSIVYRVRIALDLSVLKIRHFLKYVTLGYQRKGFNPLFGRIDTAEFSDSLLTLLYSTLSAFS